MKKSLYLFLFLFVTILGTHAQSSYITLSNRVLISGIINQDTLIIENLKNKVLINGALGQLSVEYNNQDARIVDQTPATLDDDERADIVIQFWNEYAWLDERIKTTNPVEEFTDEINIAVGNEKTLIPVNFKISKIRGLRDFSVMIQITGTFSGDALKEDFPNIEFQEDLNFAIFLTVQVTN
jgi:hypothetical protein